MVVSDSAFMKCWRMLRASVDECLRRPVIEEQDVQQTPTRRALWAAADRRTSREGSRGSMTGRPLRRHDLFDGKKIWFGEPVWLGRAEVIAEIVSRWRRRASVVDPKNVVGCLRGQL